MSPVRILWRAKKRVEGIVQRFVVTTDFPPFSWCYALYYRFVLRLAVATLRRIPDVVSIYLTGGLSRNRVTLGRSDIDLMVFVHEGAQGAVRRCCKILRFFFPILPAKEVGIFAADDMNLLLREDIHLRYRLLHARVPARLLYGPDLRAECQVQEPGRSAAEALIGRFEFLWNILVHRLVHMPGGSEDDRAYLHAKLSRQFVEELPRDHEPTTPEPPPAISGAEETYRTGVRSLLELGRYCAVEVAACAEAPPRIDLQDLSLTMGLETRSILDGFVEWLLKRHAKKLRSVLIGPSYVLPVTERELSLYMVQSELLELDEVKVILQAAHAAGMRDRIALHLLSRDISFSLDLQDLSRSVTAPLTKAAMFLYLGAPECVLHGVPLDPLPPVCDLRAIARDKKDEIRACLDGQALTRLVPLAFQELIWQVLQTTSIIEMDRFPLTSAQVCGLWRDRPGLEWLSLLHEQYPADLDGRPSQSERFFQRGIALIRGLLEDRHIGGGQTQ